MVLQNYCIYLLLAETDSPRVFRTLVLVVREETGKLDGSSCHGEQPGGTYLLQSSFPRSWRHTSVVQGLPGKYTVLSSFLVLEQDRCVLNLHCSISWIRKSRKQSRCLPRDWIRNGSFYNGVSLRGGNQICQHCRPLRRQSPCHVEWKNCEAQEHGAIHRRLRNGHDDPGIARAAMHTVVVRGYKEDSYVWDS